LLANATREVLRAELIYRQWKAGYIRALLEEDPKLSEWKIKALVEAAQQFGRHKTAQLEAARNLVVLQVLAGVVLPAQHKGPTPEHE
jgi:hypothetical protein